jgi:hypothetical protein
MHHTDPAILGEKQKSRDPPAWKAASYFPQTSAQRPAKPMGHPNCTVERSMPMTRLSWSGKLLSQSKTGSTPLDVR